MASSQAPKPPSLFEDNFVEEGMLGDGSFGTVYKCKNSRNGVSYAVKVTNFSDEALKEVSIIHNLPPHPNVVQYFDFWKDEFPRRHRISDLSSSPGCEKQRNVKVLCIPMELCNGTLHSWMTSQPEITEQMYTNICLQLICGLEHIHRNNIIHRDLKPENILIGLDAPIMKIGDFDLSSQHGDATSHTPDVGNRLYRAPEQETGHYDSSADIYAMGLILFELGYSQIERCRDREKIRKVIRELKQGKKIPLTFQERWGHSSQLILKMIKDNPNERPSAAEVKDYLSNESRKFSERSESVSDKRRLKIRGKSIRNYFQKDNIEASSSLENTKNQTFWNVVKAVPHFIGRKDELHVLNNFLAERKTPILIITGMGGQGKTQLCRYWIRTIKKNKDCPKIIWLAGENSHDLTSSLLNFIGFTNPEFGELKVKGFAKIAERAINILECDDNVLWIVDNVDSEYVELKVFAMTVLKLRRNSKIIITSRLMTFFSMGAQYLMLQTLSVYEAKELVQASISENTSDEEVGSLCKEMGYHALALRLSIGYISQRINKAGRNAFRIQDFLQQFRKNKLRVLDNTERLADYEGNVLHNIKHVTKGLIIEEADAVKDILLVLSLVRHDGLDLDFLLEMVSIILKYRNKIFEFVKNALDTLHSIFLIEAEWGVVRIHPLIQESVRVNFPLEWPEVAYSILTHIEVDELPKENFQHIFTMWEIASNYDPLMEKIAPMVGKICTGLVKNSEIQSLFNFTSSHKDKVLRISGSEKRREVLRAEFYFAVAHLNTCEYKKALRILESLRGEAIDLKEFHCFIMYLSSELSVSNKLIRGVEIEKKEKEGEEIEEKANRRSSLTTCVLL